MAKDNADAKKDGPSTDEPLDALHTYSSNKVTPSAEERAKGEESSSKASAPVTRGTSNHVKKKKKDDQYVKKEKDYSKELGGEEDPVVRSVVDSCVLTEDIEAAATTTPATTTTTTNHVARVSTVTLEPDPVPSPSPLPPSQPGAFVGDQRLEKGRLSTVPNRNHANGGDDDDNDAEEQDQNLLNTQLQQQDIAPSPPPAITDDTESRRYSDLSNGHFDLSSSMALHRSSRNDNNILATANLIPEEDEDSVLNLPLRQVNMEEEQERRDAQQKQQRLFFVWTLSVLLWGALAAYFAVLVLDNNNDNDNNNNNKESVPPPSTPAPSSAPSTAPTGSLDLLLLDLPDYTVESMESSSSSAQWRAFEWLVDHPDLASMPEWRKKQLFALATFFYAMEGPHWREDIQNNWMVYERDECVWFSTGYGQFSLATGEYLENTQVLDDEKNRDNMTVCNEDGEYQVLDLFGLELDGLYNAHIPPEIALLTALRIVSLDQNHIEASLPDFLPLQIYKMTNLTKLNLQDNFMVGTISSHLGVFTHMTDLWLSGNHLEGPIPTQLGQMTAMTNYALYNNHLTGTLPTELGLLTNVVWPELLGNSFTGTLPSEFGLLTNMGELSVDHNLLTGTIPNSFGSLSNMIYFLVNLNEMTGTIPGELEQLVFNGSLEYVSLVGNSFSGTIQEGLCSLGLMNYTSWNGLDFDCSADQLCGCCWCPCVGSNDTNVNCTFSLTDKFDPSTDDSDWPGKFPSPVGISNTLTINMRTDLFPEEIGWEWSILQEESFSGLLWETLDSVEKLLEIEAVYSYTMSVQSNATYRLRIMDSYGDGVCCLDGNGWFSITNSTPSSDFQVGTVMWNATGDALEERLDVYLRVDSFGNAEPLANIPTA